MTLASLKGYPVHFHLGVQERSVPDLSGEILGYRNKHHIALSKAYLTEVKLTNKAITVMQSTGRGPCRDMIEGKAGAQESWIIYHEDSDHALTTMIKGCFPRCQWKTWPLKTVSRLDEVGLMQTVQDSIQRYLDSLPNEVERVSSRQLKRELKAEKVASRTWTACIQAVAAKVALRHIDSLMTECAFQWFRGSFLRGRALEKGRQSLVRETAKAYGLLQEVA